MKNKSKLSKKRLKRPCKSCPFARGRDSDWDHSLGGSPPEVYLGQARGEFWLPCHMDKEYSDKDSSPLLVAQCAGAAIFRANCDDGLKRPDHILKLDADTKLVFSNQAEFLSFYRDIDMGEASLRTEDSRLDFYLYLELMKIR